MSDLDKLKKIDSIINKFLETYLISLRYPVFYKLLKKIQKVIRS